MQIFTFFLLQIAAASATTAGGAPKGLMRPQRSQNEKSKVLGAEEVSVDNIALAMQIHTHTHTNEDNIGTLSGEAGCNDKYQCTWLATGCPNSQVNIDWWVTQPDWLVFSDMYAYCSLTATGAATEFQRNQCCGIGIACNPICAQQTIFKAAVEEADSYYVATGPSCTGDNARGRWIRTRDGCKLAASQLGLAPPSDQVMYHGGHFLSPGCIHANQGGGMQVYYNEVTGGGSQGSPVCGVFPEYVYYMAKTSSSSCPKGEQVTDFEECEKAAAHMFLAPPAGGGLAHGGYYQFGCIFEKTVNGRALLFNTHNAAKAGHQGQLVCKTKGKTHAKADCMSKQLCYDELPEEKLTDLDWKCNCVWGDLASSDEECFLWNACLEDKRSIHSQSFKDILHAAKILQSASGSLVQEGEDGIVKNTQDDECIRPESMDIEAVECSCGAAQRQVCEAKSTSNERQECWKCVLCTNANICTDWQTKHCTAQDKSSCEGQLLEVQASKFNQRPRRTWINSSMDGTAIEELPVGDSLEESLVDKRSC